MKLKPGVDILGIKPELLVGLQVAEAIYTRHSHELVVTSVTEAITAAGPCATKGSRRTCACMGYRRSEAGWHIRYLCMVCSSVGGILLAVGGAVITWLAETWEQTPGKEWKQVPGAYGPIPAAGRPLYTVPTMPRSLITLFTLSLLVLSAGIFADSANRDLGAVRLSTRELGSIIEAVESQLETDSHGTLKLGNGERAIERSGDYSPEALEDAPDPSTEVTYTFFSREGPITLVVIKLDRHYSWFQLEGASGPKVEALAAYIQARFAAHRTLFGGELKAIPAYALFSLVVLLGVVRYFGLPSTERGLALTVILGAGALAVGWKASRLLPMVRVYQGEPYSDLQINIAGGLVVAAIVAALSLGIKLLRRGSRAASSAGAKVEPKQ